jgi:hypothetical protein
VASRIVLCTSAEFSGSAVGAFSSKEGDAIPCDVRMSLSFATASLIVVASSTMRGPWVKDAILANSASL